MLDRERVRREITRGKYGVIFSASSFPGLTTNYVTKLLVPALYAIFVLDLKLIKWRERPAEPNAAPYHSPSAVTQPLEPLS